MAGVWIEELELDVADDEVAGYVARDAEVWTAFLAEQPGFVRKEVWRPVDRPGALVLQIWWTSREHWKAVTPEQVAQVDARMGRHRRDVRCREYEVLWSS